MSRSGGPLGMLGPEKITLGIDTLAEIHLKMPDSGSPRLVANVGKIGQPAPMEGGLLATYTPPDEIQPGVAIIAALRPDGSLWDWLAIPLLGQTVVNIKGPRRAEVEVHVGDHKFGPTRFDRRGRARMSITTPPGVDTAVTVVTDRRGRRSEGTTPIRAPKFNRMMLFCPPGRISAVVVSPTGAPQPDQRFSFKGPGTFGVPTMTAPGTYRVSFEPSARAKSGTRVPIKAGLAGDKASSASCRLEVRSGQIAYITMNVTPKEVVAGSGIPVVVTMDVRDSAGRPAQPEKIDLGTDLGTVGKVRSVAPGRFEATWQLPDEIGDKQRAFARVTVDGVLAEAGIDLTAGRIAKLNLTAADQRLTANGRATTVLTVTPLDPGGNLARGATLSARSNGTVSEFRGPNADGQYEATYTAPLSFESARDAIVVEEADSGFAETITIELTPGRRAFLLGLKGGVTTNLGPIFTGIGTIDFAFRIPILDEGLRVGVETGFMMHRDERALSSGGRATVDVWAVPVVGRLMYGLPVGDTLEIVIGGGAGVYVTRVEVSPRGDSPVRPQRVTQPSVAAGGLLALELGAGPGAVVVEAQYTWVGLEDGNVEGNVGGLAGFLGYRIAL